MAAYSKNAIVEIFELLWRETDDAHGLTANEIVERLEEHHREHGDDGYKAPSNRTVREQLYWLKDNPVLGRSVGRIDQSALPELRRRCADPQPGWYMEPYLSASEMRLLADSLMLSRLSEDTLGDLEDKIAALSGGREGYPREASHIDAFEHYNSDFLHTIEGVDRAIHEGRAAQPPDELIPRFPNGRAVRFQYCDYMLGGALEPRRRRDGSIRWYTLDPYRLVYKTGRYYLVGYLHHKHHAGAEPHDENLTCFIADRIRDLHVLDPVRTPVAHTLDRWRADGTLRDDDEPSDPNDVLDPVEYVRQRPYFVTGEAVPITMVVRRGMLGTVYEWFDAPDVSDSGQCDDEGNPMYEVVVRCPELSMMWWTLQYSTGGDVIVLSPQSLRQSLYEAGQRLIRQYRPK
ncbi:helix-turn-helix transcriptional regulator [Bifidobacterium vansinderenii]|uniref:WYL domain-containing protein n=1 Tax=Bifidobacterium vansinderenii TaxID=1984871 RepID=A0A229VUW9_9BIFI|nr:WYL domain-containing protein [Bifidobacterium vansinderenii]OXM99335.1 WYL domain-containing protein [Bifidobacterium vansinderenii]